MNTLNKLVNKSINPLVEICHITGQYFSRKISHCNEMNLILTQKNDKATGT